MKMSLRDSINFLGANITIMKYNGVSEGMEAIYTAMEQVVKLSAKIGVIG